MEIIPAIMPKNYEDLKNKIALVRDFVSMIQIDICDGNYVSTITWPFADGSEQTLNSILNEQEGMPFWENVDFEFDLMVAGAMADFDMYLKLGAKRIVFHIAAISDKESFLQFLEGIDIYVKDSIQIGIAIETTTPIESIVRLIPEVNFVQCMGIERAGRQGQPFDERVLSQIKSLREKFPELTISVDGGVNLETAESLITAGADRLIIGSAILTSDDIGETIRAFKRL